MCQARGERHSIGLYHQALGGEVGEPAVRQQWVDEALQHFIELPGGRKQIHEPEIFCLGCVHGHRGYAIRELDFADGSHRFRTARAVHRVCFGEYCGADVVPRSEVRHELIEQISSVAAKRW